jgi:hypothetical protein
MAHESHRSLEDVARSPRLAAWTAGELARFLDFVADSRCIPAWVFLATTWLLVGPSTRTSIWSFPPGRASLRAEPLQPGVPPQAGAVQPGQVPVVVGKVEAGELAGGDGPEEGGFGSGAETSFEQRVERPEAAGSLLLRQPGGRRGGRGWRWRGR